MKVSSEYSSNIHFFNLSDLMSSIEDEVLSVWLAHPVIGSLFEKYGMDEGYFKEHYARSLYHSFMDVIRGVKSGESCPFIHTLIDYFKNRDVTLTDLNHFFTIYRQSILKILARQAEFTAELFDEVQQILDYQFHDALEYYNGSFFSKDSGLKKELILFREYQKVIDKSAIVSKANPNGIITYVNQAFCHTTGYAYDEVIGKSHNLVRHPDSPPVFFEELWGQISSKKVFHTTIKNRKKNGDTYYVDATIVPILDEDNTIIEFIAMSYDITQLIEAVETAKIAQRVKDEFLANMSHEIRTPLNAIMGFISILRKQVSDTKGAHYIDVIHSSSKMLLDIVNDVLDLSKMQSGKFTIANEPFSPSNELSNTISLFASKAQEKSIRYGVYIDPKLPRFLLGDGSRIKQIVSNFLSNAIKFTPNGGSVKVKAVYENGELRVSVQDSGIGVSPQKQAKIFEAFEQADSSITRNFGGTGLGLSICTQLITQMEGKIVFRSVENKGSLFGFQIPCGLSDDKPECIYPSFASLRIAFLDSGHESEMAVLLEKYLRDFGISQIEYSSEAIPEKADLIFVPAVSEHLESLTQASVPVILLSKNNVLSHPLFRDADCLCEPLLPDEIVDILSCTANN